jgi:hypothetical protein
MTPELEGAIANAKRVFARYALNGRIIVCNSCVAPEMRQAARLRDLKST